MSAIAHFVYEDYVQGTGITPGYLPSRIGTFIAYDDGNNDHRPVIIDAAPSMLRPNGDPVKASNVPNGFLIPRINDQTQTNGFIPVPGMSAVRTYEIIARPIQDNHIARCQDGFGRNCEIDLDGSAVLLVKLENIDEEQATLEVSGAEFGDDGLYHHIVIVVDLSDPVSKTAKLYIDGELIGTDTQDLNLLPPQWDEAFFTNYVSTMSGSTGGTPDPGVVEMMVHDVELTAEDIQRRSFYMRAINAQQV